MSRWYYHYVPAKPREVKGGIKAQTKRGKFAGSWWAERWIEILESFNIGERLNRGKRYARSGQVISIDIEKGKVRAKVQGTRRKPYDVKIKVEMLSYGDWKKVGESLSKRAVFGAKLMAGEMPHDIEEVFLDANLSLFPSKMDGLETDCSCPDWSNPCKHIAAVYYLLGEEFDRDPFLIFKLRGISREKLIELIMDSERKSPVGKKQDKEKIDEHIEEAVMPPEPLSINTAEFWGGIELPDDLSGEPRIPAMAAALPRRLGNFPFWRGEEIFLSAIEPIYESASRQALDLLIR